MLSDSPGPRDAADARSHAGERAGAAWDSVIGPGERSASRHMLSRSLGSELFVNADVCEHLLLPGDVLLLSSDGLHGAVRSPIWLRLFSEMTTCKLRRSNWCSLPTSEMAAIM